MPRRLRFGSAVCLKSDSSVSMAVFDMGGEKKGLLWFDEKKRLMSRGVLSDPHESGQADPGRVRPIGSS